MGMEGVASGICIGGSTQAYFACRWVVLDYRRPDPHLRRRPSRPARDHQPAVVAPNRRLAADRSGGLDDRKFALFVEHAPTSQRWPVQPREETLLQIRCRWRYG